jgi:hypothetical protein
VAHVSDAKLAALKSQTGASEGHVDDIERLYLTQQTGEDGHVNDMWLALFQQNGATSDHIDDAAYEFLLNLGVPAGHIDDMWLYYWDTLGGAIGETVIIQRNNDTGVCEFEPPTTFFCTASETFTANDSNFTNPANTWAWEIVSGGQVTNAVLNSNNTTAGTWTTNGATLVNSFDQVGLTGAANTASLVGDSGNARVYVQVPNQSLSNNTNTHVLRLYVRKDNVQSRFPLVNTRR